MRAEEPQQRYHPFRLLLQPFPGSVLPDPGARPGNPVSVRRIRLNLKRLEDATWLALRVVAGLLFFQAGARKLFGWYG